MKITFYSSNSYWGGLSNNGGSRTILKSAETLRKLGHKVDVVAHSDKFTWFKHPKVLKKVPKNTDVIIAISINDVKDMWKKFPFRKLAYWARPFETWQMDEEKIIKRLIKFQNKYNGIIVVNSGWQVPWLRKFGINSHLVYSGKNISHIIREDPKEISMCLDENFDGLQAGYMLAIGCQYSSKPRKGWKEFCKIAELLGTDKYKYYVFGSEKKPNVDFINEYLRNPPREKLNELYQQVDLFFCTSSMEGFYNPGAEATMNGCLLFVNDELMNGCDYATVDNSYIYCSDKLDRIPMVMDNLDFGKVRKCQDYIIDNIGSRKENMKRMVEVLK